MQAFRADFVPSRIQRGLALGYAALLVCAVCAYFSGCLKWGLLAAIAACGAWVWRKLRLWLEYGQPTRAQIKRRTGVELGVRKRRKGIF